MAHTKFTNTLNIINGKYSTLAKVLNNRFHIFLTTRNIRKPYKNSQINYIYRLFIKNPKPLSYKHFIH
jgi:hypothetical protein